MSQRKKKKITIETRKASIFEETQQMKIKKKKDTKAFLKVGRNIFSLSSGRFFAATRKQKS